MLEDRIGVVRLQRGAGQADAVDLGHRVAVAADDVRQRARRIGRQMADLAAGAFLRQPGEFGEGRGADKAQGAQAQGERAGGQGR